MLDLGTVRPGSTIRIPFSSFDKDDGSSITMTNYAVADILVYKDGSTTERASTAGFTATTDFDGKTGKHLAIIDLSDNTTSGFWNAGSEYLVAIDAVTVDAVTTGGWIARFRIGYPSALIDTTIATLSSQTSFTLTTGPAEDDALNNHYAIIHDIASAVQLSRVLISDYVGSTKTITLAAGATFTAAAGDNISILYEVEAVRPTVAGRTLDVSTGGEAGIDWANVGSQSTSVNLSATTTNLCNTITTYTGNTVQTGDAFARIGAAGAGLTALGDTRVANLDATVSSRSTLTQTQVTGGAYALNNASFAFNSAMDFTTAQKAATLARVTLVDTVTSVSAIATNGIVAGSIASNALTSTKGDTGYYASIAAAVWQTLTGTAYGTVGSVGEDIAQSLDTINTLLTDIIPGLQGYDSVYYVSSTTGNDSDSGLTLSAAKLTLAGAKSAAASGSLIVVLPGTYNEKNLFKTGVDWYFARGAIVNYTGSGTGGMFDDSSLGANGAVVCRVFGYGRFIHATSNGSTIAPTLRVANASSRVLFECLDISNTSPLGSSAYGISHEAGALDVKVIGTISSTNSNSVSNTAGAGRFTCEADTYSGGVSIGGANAFVKGRAFLNSSGNALTFSGSPTNVICQAEHVSGQRAAYVDLDDNSHSVTIYAKRMQADVSSGGAIECDNAGTLYVVGASIENIAANSTGVYAGSGIVYLRDCSARGTAYDLENYSTMYVQNVDYRRANVFGTLTEAPPADYVTSTYGKVDTEVAAIKAKTDSLPSDPADASDIAALLATITGFVDTEVAAIKTVTDQLVAAQAEPVAVPAANATPLQKLAWLAMLARNKITETATNQIVKADDGTTTVGTATVSDDGTTFTRGEFA